MIGYMFKKGQVSSEGVKDPQQAPHAPFLLLLLSPLPSTVARLALITPP
jgi:hypothetical protein